MKNDYRYRGEMNSLTFKPNSLGIFFNLEKENIIW